MMVCELRLQILSLLPRSQPREQPLLRHEPVVAALFDHPAAVEDAEAVPIRPLQDGLRSE